MKKDISAYLVKGLRKSVVVSIATEIVQDEETFRELLRFIEEGNRTEAMKAAWILSTAAGIDNRIAAKHAKKILSLLSSSSIGGVQRELIKILYLVPKKETVLGPLIDLSFRILHDPEMDLAVKYYASIIIEKSLPQYPGLRNELITLLESQLDGHTAAWKKYMTKRISVIRKQNHKSTPTL